MDMVLKNLSKKILNMINVETQDHIVIEYGIQQMFLIVLNVLTVIILGTLWKELLFSLLFLLWFVMLRPFAGGYHADTKSGCYLLSIVALNCILAYKSQTWFSIPQYFIVWSISVVLILGLAPVANSSNPLEEKEIKVYKKKVKKLVVLFSMIMFGSILLETEVIYSSIVYSLFLICILLVAGKRKYRHMLSVYH